MALDKSEFKETKGFTFVPKEMYQDSNLSLKAKGLLSLIIALPDDYNPCVAGLVSYGTNKKDSVTDGLFELERQCYLIRTHVKDEKGKYEREDYKPFPFPYNRSKPETPFKELASDEPGISNIRIEDDGYTHISNYHLYDHNLSYEAKGLLSYLFSYPSGWRFTYENIAKKNSDGTAAIGHVILELKINGYLKLEQARNDEGRFGHSIYVFFKKPNQEAIDNFFNNEYPDLDEKKKKTVKSILKKRKDPLTENPFTENPFTEIPHTVKPSTGKQKMENPKAENPTQTNNINNNNIDNKNISSSSFDENKNKTPSVQPDRGEMKKKIKEQICYDYLIERNNAAMEMIENTDDMSDRMFENLNKQLIRENILEEITEYLTDLFMNPATEISISGNKVSASKLIEKYEWKLHVSDAESIYNAETVRSWVKRITVAKPTYKRNYFYRMLLND